MWFQSPEARLRCCSVPSGSRARIHLLFSSFYQSIDPTKLSHSYSQTIGTWTRHTHHHHTGLLHRLSLTTACFAIHLFPYISLFLPFLVVSGWLAFYTVLLHSSSFFSVSTNHKLDAYVRFSSGGWLSLCLVWFCLPCIPIGWLVRARGVSV